MLSRIRGAPTPAKYGCLFDGTSNLSLTGKIAPFELGYIQESAKELKARRLIQRSKCVRSLYIPESADTTPTQIRNGKGFNDQ